MFDITKSLSSFFAAIIFVLFAGLLLGLPTMLLWNWLMPVIFGLTKISFWQAMGLNILSGILLKGSNNPTSK